MERHKVTSKVELLQRNFLNIIYWRFLCAIYTHSFDDKKSYKQSHDNTNIESSETCVANVWFFIIIKQLNCVILHASVST